ncbi:hypothetical protein Dda_7663 [Drechslerella dactyloides]|uniref:Uncharacterized protein n=1 Tax=Drechslerella dactyloides TaxID=74499 RepID=A0AAD6NGY8_DREDA|nr:hypothetical protein Dda_7663 [Drechslerella dactyloides]
MGTFSGVPPSNQPAIVLILLFPQPPASAGKPHLLLEPVGTFEAVTSDEKVFDQGPERLFVG